MKKYLITLLFITSVLFLVGCGKKKDPIVGKWANGSFVYTFNEDKTCSYDAVGTIMKCTYKTNGDKLSILYDGDTVSFDTTYKIDGKDLHVKDSFGNDTIYKRK